MNFLSLLVESQSKLGNEWVTGGGAARIKFTPIGIVTSSNHFILSYFHSGNSAICDTNGNLLLCSDGYNVYDSNANYIDGGDTLVPPYHYIIKNGCSLYSQSSIFLPIDSNKYYFITPAFSDSQYVDCQVNGDCFFDLLLYNIIDMNANAGAGKVVKRMEVLMDSASLSKTQMMACRHANGKDWWLLKQGGDSNIVYKFLFTQDSVYNYGFQKFDSPVWGKWDIKGQSVFKQDGSQYATTVQGNLTGEVFIADFDRCYGILSNPKVIAAPEGSQYNPNFPNYTERLPEGLAYSPNGQFLYIVTQFNIYQYDFLDDSMYHVAGLDTTAYQFQEYNASYLGPDGKLYIGNFGGLSKQMSVINNPDVKGAACNFCPRCLRLDTLLGTAYAGTPPCMPNYSLGAQECWALGNEEIVKEKGEILLYPNPSESQLNIRYNFDKDSKLQIVDMLGIIVKEVFLSKDTKQVSLFVNDFAPGVYNYRQIYNNTTLNTGKLIIPK
jgi:hypothetical protein